MYGSASDKIDSVYTEKAYELGCEIAKHGHSLIFGGGDYGMMGACVRGVIDNDGKSVGVAPKWIGRNEGSAKYCTEFIHVDSMDVRKKLFLELSDMFIITPGGLGTFDELFEVLTLKQLKQHDKTILIYNINGYFTKMFEVMEQMRKEFFMDPELLSPDRNFAEVANSIEDVKKYL